MCIFAENSNSASTMKIDKNIPLPTHKKGAGKPNKYPFADMEVGDSFAIAVDENANVLNTRCSLHSSANSWAKYNKKNCSFKTQVTTDNGETYIRIWRIDYRQKNP